MFVKNLLDCSNLNTPIIDKFVYQDMSEIASKLPSFIGRIANVATDTASVINKLTGQGHNNLNEETLRKKALTLGATAFGTF